MTNNFDFNKFSDIVFEDLHDGPDFPDAYISHALYDGEEMTEEELDVINDSELVYDLLIKNIY